MYTKKQIEPLLQLVNALFDTEEEVTGSSERCIVSRSTLMDLLAVTTLLQEQEQHLVIGQHHNQGEGLYAFLVPEGETFDATDLRRHLREEYKPEFGHFLTVDPVASVVVISAGEHEDGPDLDLLSAGGYTVDSRDGKWYWWHPQSATESDPHPTRRAAIQEGLQVLEEEVLDHHDLSHGFWSGLAQQQKLELATKMQAAYA